MRHEEPDPQRGLVVDGRPRVSPLAVGTTIGLVWGLLGYAILWEGEPFAVDRPFVESPGGTIALLPIRVVLWAIHVAEDLACRTFELSANHWWIGVAAGAVGAALGFAVTIAVLLAARRLRRPRADGSIRA